MGAPTDRTWRGSRTPNRRIALSVLAVGVGLVAVATYRWMTGRDFNWFYLVVFLLFLFVYVFLVLSTSYEVEVTIRGEELRVVVAERILDWVHQTRGEDIPRWRMAKLRESTVGELAHTVRVEDASGGTLVTFPRFLGLEEHEAMIASIIHWGNQPSVSSEGDASPSASPVPQQAGHSSCEKPFASLPYLTKPFCRL